MKKNIKMILLFSHQLTKTQIIDAKDTFGICEFLNLPKNLQDIWSNIPTELKNLQTISNKFKEFIKQHANKNDIVFIQGDFGMTYHMINFCKKLDLKTVYSVTKRNIQEKKIGDKVIKTSVFVHVKFREY